MVYFCELRSGLQRFLSNRSSYCTALYNCSTFNDSTVSNDCAAFNNYSTSFSSLNNHTTIFFCWYGVLRNFTSSER